MASSPDQGSLEECGVLNNLIFEDPLLDHF